MAKTKKAQKSTKAVSTYVLPPDAKHFQQEDLQLAPTGLFGNMATSQVNRPALLIVQPMSRMPDAVRNIGRIYNTVTGNFYDEVELAIVVAPAEFDVPRVMKEQKFDKQGTPVYDYNAPIVCGSPNGVRPYVDYIGMEVGEKLGAEFENEVIPEACDGCIFNSANICRPMYRYFALQILDGKAIPVVFRIKGLAFDAGRDLNTKLQQLEGKNEYWTFKMTVIESPRKEKVFVPQFEPFNKVADAEFMRYVYGLNADYRAKQERILNDQNLRVAQMQEDCQA